MSEKLHVPALVRKIILIMFGRVYIHVRLFTQNEEICSLKECKSHLNVSWPISIWKCLYRYTLRYWYRYSIVTSRAYLVFYDTRSGWQSLNIILTKCQRSLRVHILFYVTGHTAMFRRDIVPTLAGWERSYKTLVSTY